MALRPMFTFVVKITKHKTVTGVEVGVQYGGNAKYILTMPNLDKLYLVDFWEPYQQDGKGYDFSDGYEKTKQMFADNPKVEIRKGSSVDEAKKFADESLDFVYIDSNHSYEAVKADIEAWHPKIMPRGVIGGHDYKQNTRPMHGLIKAVNEYMDKNSYVLHAVDNDWWAVKQRVRKEPKK